MSGFDTEIHVDRDREIPQFLVDFLQRIGCGRFHFGVFIQHRFTERATRRQSLRPEFTDRFRRFHTILDFLRFELGAESFQDGFGLGAFIGGLPDLRRHREQSNRARHSEPFEKTCKHSDSNAIVTVLLE